MCRDHVSMGRNPGSEPLGANLSTNRNCAVVGYLQHPPKKKPRQVSLWPGALQRGPLAEPKKNRFCGLTRGVTRAASTVLRFDVRSWVLGVPEEFALAGALRLWGLPGQVVFYLPTPRTKRRPRKKTPQCAPITSGRIGRRIKKQEAGNAHPPLRPHTARAQEGWAAQWAL